ncbi:MAG: ATP-dependent DNA helicase [Deltaproteobacteria bacterium]|nr:ATP-dependent DNA helicase [Deltaproteobacteria bacterium]
MTLAQAGIDALGLETLAPLLEETGGLVFLESWPCKLDSDLALEDMELVALRLEPGSSELSLRTAIGIDHFPALLREMEDCVPVVRDLADKRIFFNSLGVEAFHPTRSLDLLDLFALTHPDAPDLGRETLARLLNTEPSSTLRDAPGSPLGLLRALVGMAEGARAGQLRYRAAARALASYVPNSIWRKVLGEAPTIPVEPDQPDYLRIEESSEEPVPFDEEAIAAALSDEERGRRHFPGYRVREEQVELARQFVRVLQDGKYGLLEGGTGVGKSLAYLAAVIPYVMTGPGAEQKRPVVISTRTKLLQDQLTRKDIAAAARFLGHSALHATAIKGRANYACQRRLLGTLSEGLQPLAFEQDRYAYAVLEVAASVRTHGEVAALPRAFHRRYPLLNSLVRQAVSARSDHCSREECAVSYGCAFGERRRALSGAQVLVANHDLLLRWPTDYPAFGDVIVDEAHELPGVADEVYAVGIRPEEILERFDEVFGLGKAESSLFAPATLNKVAKKLQAWRMDLRQDLVALGSEVFEFSNSYGELEVPSSPGSAYDGAADAAQMLSDRFIFISQEMERLREMEEERSDKGISIRRIEDEFLDVAAALLRVFSGEETTVSAFEGLKSPFDRWRLSVRPVSPALQFHQGFLSQLDSFAAVSATLFMDGDSFAALGELELSEWAEERLLSVTVPSPFPYEEQMRVAAMRSRGELVDEMSLVLQLLAQRLGGRTLGLFTSLKRMQEAASLLRPVLAKEGIEVLVPSASGDDPAALVERFRNSEHAVLLGARTFWQGLDLPGETLQAVVIEKLPFEVPTQLRKRRENRLRARGADAFRRYTLGKMLLSLKQMAGRLIRSEEDRGIVVIVESRHDRSYFHRLGDAFPPGVKVTLTQSQHLASLVDAVGIPEGSDGPR